MSDEKRTWVKSGLSNTFRVTLEGADEPLVVHTTPGDAVAWERNNKGESYLNNLSTSSMLWTAWRRLKVSGAVEGQFDAFCERVVEFEIEKVEAADDAVDPSRTDPLDD